MLRIYRGWRELALCWMRWGIRTRPIRLCISPAPTEKAQRPLSWQRSQLWPGEKTGLHTSPHLYRMTERLRVDGVPAPDTWIAEAVNEYRAVFEKEKVSFF